MIISIDNQNFDFASALHGVESKTIMFNPKNGKREFFPDFGIVIVGDLLPWEAFSNPLNPSKDEFDELMGLVEVPVALVRAPSNWKMTDIVCKLGMFPSRSQAIKNGFGMDIPFGFEQWFVRVNKMRGVITTFKTFQT